MRVRVNDGDQFLSIVPTGNDPLRMSSRIQTKLSSLFVQGGERVSIINLAVGSVEIVKVFPGNL